MYKIILHNCKEKKDANQRCESKNLIDMEIAM